MVISTLRVAVDCLVYSEAFALLVKNLPNLANSCDSLGLIIRRDRSVVVRIALRIDPDDFDPGYIPALGHTSFRYSAIASVSHTVTPSCTRHGTRIDEARSSSSARVSGSSDATTCLLEVEPRQPGEQEAAQRP